MVFGGNFNPYDATVQNSFGLINELIYPGGGWVKYKWAMSANYQQVAGFTGTHLDTNGNPDGNYPGGACVVQYKAPVVSSRQVSYDGVNVAQTQTFQYSTTWSGSAWTSKTTTVTTQDNLTGKTSVTTYTYAPGYSLQGFPFWNGSSVASAFPVEQTVQYKDWDGTVLRTVSKTWFSASDLQEEDVTENGKTRKTTYCYQPSGSCTPSGSGTNRVHVYEKKEYGYDNNVARRTVYQYHTFPNSSLGLPFPSQVSAEIVYNGSGTRVAETDYSYDDFAVASMANVVQRDDLNYGTGATVRGNLTKIIKKCFVGTTACATDSITSYTYDQTGQTVSMIDPCGYNGGNPCSGDMTGANHTTTYSHTDSPAGGNAAGQSNAYLTQITHPQTNGVTMQESFTYNYVLGDVLTSTDANGRTTTYKYNDPRDRLTETDFPDSSSVMSTNTYNDMPLPSSVTNSQTITAALQKTSAATFDGLFHVVKAQLTSDPDCSGASTDTTYDGMGSAWKVSNPHCTAASSTDGVTETQHDALGRTTKIIRQDGSFLLTTYTDTCNSNTNTLASTVTDEAGKQRRSCSDALGRLVEVDEPPAGGGSLTSGYVTLYGYDTLDNLLRVDQKGTAPSDSTQWRTRTFTYDSLSRLLTATNPESGTITYAYDANGNVASKVAPTPNKIPADTSSPQTVTATYSYDTLNRLIQKSYNDTPQTPTVKYGYDGVALSGCTTTPPTLTDSNPKGRRTSMCDGSGATTWASDFIAGTGWKSTESRTINGVSVPKTIISQNNLGGMLSTLTYPSTRVVTFTPSAAGRITDAKDVANGFNYVTGAHYAPTGGLASLNNGASVKFTEIYNQRLQPCWIYATTGTALPGTTGCTGTATAGTLIDLKYNFNLGTTDNGNVIGISNNRVTGRTQSFTYDALNRIATGQSQATSGSDCWGQNFTIDAWGNLTNETVRQCSAPMLNAPATVKNQISGYCYDLAGNLLGTSACPSLPYTPTYTFDAENRLLCLGNNCVAGGVWVYTYDGDGNRVKKANGSSGTLYWGAALAESDLTGSTSSWKDYVFFNGKRVSKRDSTTTHYFFSDELNSTSVVRNDSTGVLEEDMVYSPYGVTLSGTSADHYLFNGKERDTESGLDEYGARYYSSSQGRFTIPDWAAKPTAVPYANYGNPQSLNLYSYVQNNPTTLGDPDGHDGCGCLFTEDDGRRVGQAVNNASDFVNDLGASIKQDLQHAAQALAHAAQSSQAALSNAAQKVNYKSRGVGIWYSIHGTSEIVVRYSCFYVAIWSS